jgi:ribonucleoside-diphosphate reductase alpha chain
MRPSLRELATHLVRGLRASDRLVEILARDPLWEAADDGLPEAPLVLLASQHIAYEPAFERLALRAVLATVYREALGWEVARQGWPPSPEAYRAGLVRYLTVGVAVGELDPRLLEFDLPVLARALAPERDEWLTYTGITTLADRYLVRHPETRALLETPQFLFMRVAMGLSLAEPAARRTAWALRFYEALSRLHYLPSTPTLFNAGTTHPQLSSCYLADVLDSLDHILESARDFGYLAKYAGGIGAAITKLRAVGSPVRGINGQSSGIIPFAHLYDALIKAISQGGRRRGTLALYLEPWHLEIEAFLDLKRNAGDPYQRTPSLNTALWVPDEFLRRVEADEDWYLFDPAYVPELPETFGEAFRLAYERYIHQARTGALPARAFRVVRARDLLVKILASLQETAHPWITFKDTGNARSMLAGIIHSSNLCTEIFLPTSPDEIAVCNLASVNLARHLTPAGAVDWAALRQTVRVAMRGLDNVIDINLYPVEKARRSNQQNRPVGLGIMGLAEVFARQGLTYGDEDSQALTDRVVEFISYCAIEASCDLAEERGQFPAFAASRWARGQVPIDTLDALTPLGRAGAVERSARLDWDHLRGRVRRGLRNGTVMAIAPTATIALIAGTTPSLDPYYANVFARQTLSGKFLEVNPVLVEQLKALGLWESVRERIIAERGDIAEITEIPVEIRRRFPTAYQIPPRAYIDIAARAQKWVDMGISRNLYLQERDLDRMADVYLYAWRKGLKSTYYLFMAPRMYAEPSTVPVNKTRQRLKWRFLEESPPAAVCSLERSCESCQ